MSATRVCSLSELEQDAAKRVVIDGTPIAVVKDSNGDVHAIGDTCTLNLPAYEPVPVYEVTIEGDDVLIDPAVTKAVTPDIH